MSQFSQQLRDAIHSYFREFGQETAELIFKELVRSGGMPKLLTRLGLSDPGYSDDQYASILNFIRRHGVDHFKSKLKVAGRDQSSSSALPGKAPANAGAEPITQRSVENIPREQPRKSGDYKVEDVARTTKDQIDKIDQRALDLLKRAGAKKREITESSAGGGGAFKADPPSSGAPGVGSGIPQAIVPVPPPKPTASPNGVLSNGEWDGVTERRKGVDRRQGTDRRNKVELVFKNNRFGGDRRSGKERRRNWPSK